MTSILSKIVFFILLVTNLHSQNIDSAWVYNNYIKTETLISMRDGVKLFTTIYSPKSETEKHPILMLRTPYSVAPYGKDTYSTRLFNSYWKNYLKENYIIVLQDVRGKFMSEGEFVDMRPFIENKINNKQVDEASDAYDAIDWLVKNVNGNNGKVGVFGVSYPGFYATMAAMSNHPALKSVSPQAPVTNWFIGDDFHHNGAFALMDGFRFYSSFGKTRPKPVTIAAKGYDFPEKDNYHFYLSQGPLRNFKKLIGDSVKFWDDLMSHPNYDEFWQERDARKACKNVKPAVLVVGGTFDAEDCWGAWNLYKAIVKQSPLSTTRLVMGPWIHGGWSKTNGSYLGNIRFGEKTSTYYQQELELPFFNFHLKGKGELSQLSKATIFFSGENKWKQFDQWPPKNTKDLVVYFNTKGSLTFEKPMIEKDYTAYISDPAKPVPYADGIHLLRTNEYMNDDQRFASRRTDVLSFETNTLTEDLTIAGPVLADLKVSLSTSDADFVVKIIDVFPDNFSYDSNYCCKSNRKESEMGGYQMLVRGEIMRGKYRNSFEKPEAFTPHKIETVKFELPDVAHTFKKGHKLMVQVQSSWFPLFDRNPQTFTNIYTCSASDFVSSEVKVLHNKSDASSIHLMVLVDK